MEILKKKIEGVNPKRVEEGTIGFISEEKWYNVAGEPEALKELLKNVVSKGNTIEFEYNNGVVGSLKLIEAAPKEKGSFLYQNCFFKEGRSKSLSNHLKKIRQNWKI